MALQERANLAPGPLVEWDNDRNCYGLRADVSYARGTKVTSYGGFKSIKPLNGDYVAKSGEVYIDGEWDFWPDEKGRWINESDRLRMNVNVKIGRDVRATRDIVKGEWLFADYGDEYERNY